MNLNSCLAAGQGSKVLPKEPTTLTKQHKTLRKYKLKAHTQNQRETNLNLDKLPEPGTSGNSGKPLKRRLACPIGSLANAERRPYHAGVPSILSVQVLTGRAIASCTSSVLPPCASAYGARGGGAQGGHVCIFVCICKCMYMVLVYG